MKEYLFMVCVWGGCMWMGGCVCVCNGRAGGRVGGLSGVRACVRVRVSVCVYVCVCGWGRVCVCTGCVCIVLFIYSPKCTSTHFKD